jgi:hypothetical protein
VTYTVANSIYPFAEVRRTVANNLPKEMERVDESERVLRLKYITPWSNERTT